MMERLWSFKHGDPEYSFSVGGHSGRIKRRVTPAPYSKPHPTLIRVATREAGIVRAAQKGWPVFVGVLGADLREQMQIYRRALDEANHPQEVKDNCLRWCSYDWVGVTVAETDEKALEREKLARAETMAIRTSYVEAARPDGWAGDEVRVGATSVDGWFVAPGPSARCISTVSSQRSNL